MMEPVGEIQGQVLLLFALEMVKQSLFMLRPEKERIGQYLEAKAMRFGLEYCINCNLLPLILETASLVIKKVLDGV